MHIQSLQERAFFGHIKKHALGPIKVNFIFVSEVVAEQIGSLLGLAAAHDNPSPTTHKRALLRRVTETIRERCHEPDLDPATVAASDGLGIVEIAWSCGFSEPSQFTHRFRERFGSAPRTYRLNMAN